MYYEFSSFSLQREALAGRASGPVATVNACNVGTVEAKLANRATAALGELRVGIDTLVAKALILVDLARRSASRAPGVCEDREVCVAASSSTLCANSPSRGLRTRVGPVQKVRRAGALDWVVLGHVGRVGRREAVRRPPSPRGSAVLERHDLRRRVASAEGVDEED